MVFLYLFSCSRFRISDFKEIFDLFGWKDLFFLALIRFSTNVWRNRVFPLGWSGELSSFTYLNWYLTWQQSHNICYEYHEKTRLEGLRKGSTQQFRWSDMKHSSAKMAWLAAPHKVRDSELRNNGITHSSAKRLVSLFPFIVSVVDTAANGKPYEVLVVSCCVWGDVCKGFQSVFTVFRYVFLLSAVILYTLPLWFLREILLRFRRTRFCRCFYYTRTSIRHSFTLCIGFSWIFLDVSLFCWCCILRTSLWLCMLFVTGHPVDADGVFDCTLHNDDEIRLNTYCSVWFQSARSHFWLFFVVQLYDGGCQEWRIFRKKDRRLR